MKRQRGALLFACALLAVALAAGPALGQATQLEGSVIDEAAEALQQDPVYVHPDADPALSDSEADRLREEIAQADAGPIYIAVLPEEARAAAGGSEEELPRLLYERLRRPGTYAVAVGTELWAGSDRFPAGTVPNLASQAVEQSRGQGVFAALSAFVELVGTEARGESGGGDGGGAFGFGFLPLLLIVGGVGFFVFSFRRRRQRQQQERREFEEVRQLALDDLVALGDDLRTLDLDVEMPDADPAAKRDYVRALECYERASAELDRARRPDDLAPVTSTLEEGRYLMACTKARLEGRELPEHRPPCFFDPRHGPSVREVEWAPPGGAPRPVPACETDARLVEEGREPHAREVTVDGRSVPYWDAPYQYGPWAGGYFGGFGMLEGLLIGSMLGGGLGFGDAGFGHEGGGEGDFGGDFGGGDFGGGDFGGGDFGGGDFG